MKKILFHLNTLEQGGVERVVSNLANQFAGRQYDVVVATEWYGEREFTLNALVRRIHVGLKAADEGKSRFTKAVLRVKYLRSIVRLEKPDVVIAFDRNANYRALCAVIGIITPVIISVRNPPQTYYSSLINRILVALLFPLAAGCVFQTTGQRDFFSAKIQKKSRVILNPLNPKYIDIAPPTERRKEIVHSSRLEGYKNQAGIIQAFVRIQSDYPDYVLKLYGGDSGDGTKEVLKNIIAENRAEDYVKLMGASDTLEKELNMASLYVFNSNREGMPNALIEAMALGLPVISTDCPSGGPAALINDGIDGLLIPVGDQEALERAIRRLLDDPEYAEKLGQAARKTKERCHIEAIASEWRDYIEKIIDRSSNHVFLR